MGKNNADSLNLIFDLGRTPPQLLLHSDDYSRYVLDVGLKFATSLDIMFGGQRVGRAYADVKAAGPCRRCAGSLTAGPERETLATLINDKVITRWLPLIPANTMPTFTLDGEDVASRLQSGSLDETQRAYLLDRGKAVAAYATTIRAIELTPLAIAGTLKLQKMSLQPLANQSKAARALNVYRAVLACESVGNLNPLSALRKEFRLKGFDF